MGKNMTSQNQNKYKNQKKKRGLVTIILIVFSISLFIVYFFNSSIFYKSYLSVVSSCLENGDEIIKQKGFETVGSVNIISVNSSTEEIKVIYKGTPDKSVMRHENCHLNQIRKNKLYSCKSPHLRYFNELEAYISEKIPYEC